MEDQTLITDRLLITNRLHDWISNLDILATNDKENREWFGAEIGWVHKGMGAYFGDEDERQELLKQFATTNND